MEEEGKVDSSEIILTNLFNTFKYKSDYENVYEFIADNLMEKNNRISYYNKSLENGAKQKSKIYKQIGDLFYSSESIPYYEQGLKYDPKNEDLLIALGFQYNLKYEYEKSLSYYSKVKNWKSKSNFTTKFHCDIIGNMYYYQIEDYKKALEYYKLSNSHFSIALCFAKLKDYNKAIDQYQAEINSIEESFWGGEEDKKKYLANIHYNIGLSYAGLNKYQQAYDSFEYSYSLYELDETKFNKEEYKIASENLNWNIVTTSKNILYLIDPKRITKSGKRIKAWLKQVLFPYEKNIDATRVDYINDNKLDFDEYKNYQYSLLFLEVNCTNDQLRILKHIDYDNNGKIIINYDYDYTEFSDVIPESVGEYWLKYLCKKE